MLAGRAGAEVAAGHDDVALAHPVAEAGIQHLKAVRAQRRGILQRQITAGDDGVGVDVVAEAMDRAVKLGLVQGQADRGRVAHRVTVRTRWEWQSRLTATGKAAMWVG